MKRYVIGAAEFPQMSWDWGTRRRGVAGLGGLGVLTPNQATTLRSRLDAPYEALDAITEQLNQAAASEALRTEDVHVFQDARAALREQLDQLLLEVETLEDEGLEAWNVEVDATARAIASLAQSIRARTVVAPIGRAVSFGILAVVAGLGAVGAGLLIRYASRRGRRR